MAFNELKKIILTNSFHFKKLKCYNILRMDVHVYICGVFRVMFI
jgi:hypothetical protein